MAPPLTIKCRTFPYDEHAPWFPEQELWDDYALRDNVGIAFSGGGTRAASLTLGFLRGLRDLGLVARARYMSAASGGAWCAVPYTFLPKSVDEDNWFGAPLLPHELTPKVLDTPEGSFAFRSANADIAQLLLGNGFENSEKWSRAVAHVYLKPDGLADPEELFTFDTKARDFLKKANKNVPLSLRTVERSDRPYLLAGGAMILGSSDLDYYPFDMTPLYCGVAARAVRLPGNSHFGGGFVESCGFDSGSRSGEGKLKTCALSSYRFTLTDMMGTTSAAPAAFMRYFQLGAWLDGMPRFHAWAPDLSPTDPLAPADEVRFGDGGLYEHQGVLMQLMRGVRRIVSFVNTDSAPERCVDLARLFGIMLPRDPVDIDPARIGMKVFHEEGYLPLIDALRQHGSALMEHPLVECAHAGFRPAPGEKATILWVNNPSQDLVLGSQWFKDLPAGTKKLLAPGLSQRSDLAAFPRISTFLAQPQKPQKLIELTYAQIRLLSSYADWRVTSPVSEGGVLEDLCALFEQDPAEVVSTLAKARF